MKKFSKKKPIEKATFIFGIIAVTALIISAMIPVVSLIMSIG